MCFNKTGVKSDIDSFLETVNTENCDVQLAFFGGSFTGIDRGDMLYLLGIAKEYLDRGLISSVRLSTRPDYISEDILDILSEYGVKTIELGIQSMSDKVLSSCKRGHTADISRQACRMIKEHGFELIGSEPLKLTVASKTYGYTGIELADLLRISAIECEFADPDFLVMMLTPELGDAELSRLESVLCAIHRKSPIASAPPKFIAPQKALSIRDAIFATSEELPVSQCEGRILASLGVSCPPAVPIVVCGERIDRRAIERFAYYGISVCRVVIE